MSEGWPEALVLLDAPTLERLLTPELAIRAVREAFRLHAARADRRFPVLREPLREGVFGIKAGAVEGRGLLGFKAAGFWPDNGRWGADAHQATVILLDPRCGRPLAVLDGNRITAARTAAAGYWGIEALARRDARTLTVFGTGVQALVQVEFALRARPGIEEILYVSADRGRRPAFEAAVAAPGRTVRAEADADAAARGADIVITTTPSRAPLFAASALRAGTHVNAVGADTRGKRELPEGLLERASVFVDDLGQSRSLGELQWRPDAPASEIGEVLDGRRPGRECADSLTVLDLTGLGLQDLLTAHAALRAALASDQGRRVPWPALPLTHRKEP